MISVSTLVDNVAFMLFQGIKEGMETGRIANLNTAQTEVEAAIAELDRRRLPEEPTTINDLVGKLFVEIGSLHDKVAKCEVQLAEFQFQAKSIKDDTTRIVARTEPCNSPVEQQQKGNLTTMEGEKPAPSLLSLVDPILRSAPSTVAVVSFPGGPRTITIHPPNSPGYQSIIRDEKGDIIVDFRRTKPLRREGAFRGPLENVDWAATRRVCGRGPDLPGVRAVLSAPSRHDRPQPSSCPLPARGPSNIIARQRQLSVSMKTDPSGGVLPLEHPTSAKAPSQPGGISSSSHESSPASQPSSSAKLGAILTPYSTPPSPSPRRGRKRARESEDDEGMLLTTETGGQVSLPVDLQTVQGPMTPRPVKREELHPPEVLSKRKKLRSSAPMEELSTPSITRTRSTLDITYAA